jgi:3,4-dihydroxy 2-butanone 4-phosphate synthase
MPSTTHGALFDSIESCISSFSLGDFIIVLDSPSRENEGDLIISAEDVTPEKMAFMIRHSSGLICTPLTSQRAEALKLPQMVSENADPNRTAYTVSVDANDESVTTGISASDRAKTCRMLAHPSAKMGDLRRPGHIFPLRAREGGVRQRPGHTEAAVDFCRLAGKRQVGVICELVEDGVESAEGRAERVGAGMMRTDACLDFGRRWGLRICTIEDLVRYLDRGKDGEGKSNLAGEVNGVNGT